MAGTRILLLGPKGRDTYVTLPDDRPLSSLGETIAGAVGLPANELVLRRDNGALIDQGRSLTAARVRPGDLVLVEQARILRRFMRKAQTLPADIVTEHGYRVLPCYLVIDTSRSMSGDPIWTVNRELPLLQTSMSVEPMLAEVCQLSLVTFDVTAIVRTRLTDVSTVTFPNLEAAGEWTNYESPFTLLRSIISRDLYRLFLKGRRPYRPAVFFLSDGRHNTAADWPAAFRNLTDRSSFFGAPNVIAFGFGAALEENIRFIGTKAAYLPADGSPSANLEAFMKFLLSSLALSMTKADAVADENDPLVIPPEAPVGWRLVRIER
jgi:uncharacterized protein YegL